MKSPEEVNDEIRAQVARQYPYPKGGFETDAELQAWKDATERLFFELVNNYREEPNV